MRHRLRAPIAGPTYDPRTVERARELRREETPFERKVWGWLRCRGLLKLKFRRQQPFAGFILDFYCPAERLAIELDGPVHRGSERGQWDAERDAALSRAGIRVVRIRNEEVSKRAIESLVRRALLPSPAGRGVGGEG